MSNQSHYDFGLRALKTLLVSAGGLKRQALEDTGDVEGEKLEEKEMEVLIKGTCNNVLPKLVKEDLGVFEETLKETFPGSEIVKMEDVKLWAEILEIYEEDDRDFSSKNSAAERGDGHAPWGHVCRAPWSR